MGAENIGGKIVLLLFLTVKQDGDLPVHIFYEGGNILINHICKIDIFSSSFVILLVHMLGYTTGR